MSTGGSSGVGVGVGTGVGVGVGTGVGVGVGTGVGVGVIIGGTVGAARSATPVPSSAFRADATNCSEAINTIDTTRNPATFKAVIDPSTALFLGIRSCNELASRYMNFSIIIICVDKNEIKTILTLRHQ
jgi:hypothetical protein